MLLGNSASTEKKVIIISIEEIIVKCSSCKKTEYSFFPCSRFIWLFFILLCKLIKIIILTFNLKKRRITIFNLSGWGKRKLLREDILGLMELEEVFLEFPPRVLPFFPRIIHVHIHTTQCTCHLLPRMLSLLNKLALVTLHNCLHIGALGIRCFKRGPSPCVPKTTDRKKQGVEEELKRERSRNGGGSGEDKEDRG